MYGFQRSGITPAGLAPFDILDPTAPHAHPRRNRRPLLSVQLPTHPRPPRGRLRRTDAHEYSTETAPPPVRPAAQRAPHDVAQAPPALPPKAEHNLFVPDKEQNPSPPRETQSQKPKAIPGYRGFIRGSQHYYGLTDGEVSRRAPSHNFAPTPAGNPHEEAGPRVATESLDSAAPARVLGYSGHIPGRVTRYAETFGRTVENSFAEHRKSASPSKHRIVSTSTTEMPSGTNTIVLDKDEVRFREARALGKTLALRHELEASRATRAASGARSAPGRRSRAYRGQDVYPQKGAQRHGHGADPAGPHNDTRATCRARIAWEHVRRTCGDCLTFRRPYQRRRRQATGCSPSPISVASPIKREYLSPSLSVCARGVAASQTRLLETELRHIHLLRAPWNGAGAVQGSMNGAFFARSPIHFKPDWQALARFERR